MFFKKRFQRELVAAWCPSVHPISMSNDGGDTNIHELYDISGHGYHMKANAASALDLQKVLEGKYCIGFLGGTNSFRNPGLGSWAAKQGTINVWCRPGNGTTNLYPWGRNASGANAGDIGIYVSAASKWTFFIQDSTNSSLCDMNGTFTIDQWYMLTGTWADGDEAAFWIDGVKQTDTDSTVTELLASASYDFEWGTNGSGAGYYDGDADDFAIWERRLDPDEIKTLYELGRGGWIKSKKSRIYIKAWPIEPLVAAIDGSATIAADLSESTGTTEQLEVDLTGSAAIEADVTNAGLRALEADLTGSATIGATLRSAKYLEADINDSPHRAFTGLTDYNINNPRLTAAISPITKLPFSMSAWFKINSTPTALTYLLSVGWTHNANATVWLSGDIAGDPLYAEFDDPSLGDETRAIKNPGVQDTNWHHFLAVYTGEDQNVTVELYLDGGNKVSATNDSQDTTGASWDEVGVQYKLDLNAFRVSDAGGDFQIGDIAIWDTNLDAEDAYNLGFLKKSPLGVKHLHLRNFWPLLQGDNDEDMVGGSDFTAYNSPGYGPDIVPKPFTSAIAARLNQIWQLTVGFTGSATVEATQLNRTRQLAVDLTGTATIDAPHPTPYTQFELYDGIQGSAVVTADINTNLRHASNTIVFTQEVTYLNNSLGNTIQFTQEVSVELVLNPAASNTLEFTQEATFSGSLTRPVTTIWGTLDQQVAVIKVLPEQNASNTITFTDAAEWSRPAVNTINFTQEVLYEVYRLEEDADNTLVLTDSVDLDAVFNFDLTSVLQFSQEAIGNYEVEKAASNTIVFDHEVYHVLLEGGQVSVCGETYTKQYCILEAPFEGIQASVILPAPLWGDTENITSSMSLRSAMNGVTRTYVKTNSNRRLTYTFRLLERAKAIELLEFLRSYDSERMRLTNWKGEVWRVYLLNNPSDFVQTRRYGTDISLEFEGQKLYG